VGRAHIILQAGGHGDTATWEADQRLTIGRLPSSDVVLDDASISRRHAEILYTETGWTVRDVGSTNGTLLNGVRIGRVGQRLQQGDRLQPGKVVLTVSGLEEESHSPVYPVDVATIADAPILAPPWGQATEFRVDAAAPGLSNRGEFAHSGSHGDVYVAGDPLRDFIATSLPGALESVGAQGGAVFLSDAPSKSPILKAGQGAGFSERSSQIDPALVQRCFQQMSPTVSATRTAMHDPAVHGPHNHAIPMDGVVSVLCVPLQQGRRAHGVLCLTRSDAHRPFSERDQVVAEAIATTMSAGIASADHLLQRQRHVFMQTALALAQAVDCRDPFCAGHTRRVTDYALLLAEELQLSSADYHHLQIGTPLHDIGMLSVDDAIVRKPGRLTPAELAEVHAHPGRGVALLRSIPQLEPILPIVGCHHEHWDGSGYPDGLIGDIIPLLARVVTIADVFDALTSDRAYRKALTPAEAFSYVQRNAGALFDPQCAHAFLRQSTRIEKLVRDRHTPSPTESKRELERLRASLEATGTRRMARAEA
jgi:HD-GYP domain-containing protein (c-di-GMP phosphodiesterase class II)